MACWSAGVGEAVFPSSTQSTLQKRARDGPSVSIVEDAFSSESMDPALPSAPGGASARVVCPLLRAPPTLPSFTAALGPPVVYWRSYDFERLEALRIPLFCEHMLALFRVWQAHDAPNRAGPQRAVHNCSGGQDASKP